MSRRVYARTDIPRELRMVDHSGILSILLQWMERRREDITDLINKELNMLRRIWEARTAPGFLTNVLNSTHSLTQHLNYERRRLALRELNPEELFQLNLQFYAPGY